MNKNDLQDICTGPKQKWLAIHKSTADAWLFTFDDIHNELLGAAIEAPEADGGFVFLKECYLCASTGYTDSKGDEVFGGHIIEFWTSFKMQRRYDYWVVCWNRKEGRWGLKSLSSGEWDYIDLQSGKGKIIGHIHQPWPDEVKELLE